MAASAIYEGRMRHRRFVPVAHTFSYRLFMMYLDLGELPGLFRGRWLWSAERPALGRFHRGDHAGDPALPIDEAMRDLVYRRLGRRPSGPIRLLTHLRYFGYCFNPVSFYYCYAPDGARVEAIVAEVNNTPWGETHCYVLETPPDSGRVKRFRFAKEFHVSPFMDMDMEYDWRFTEPGERLAVHMRNRKDGSRYFDATFAARRRAISTGALASVLARYPFMTGRVISGIYLQALRLWLKGAPFVAHPGRRGPSLEKPS